MISPHQKHLERMVEEMSQELEEKDKEIAKLKAQVKRLTGKPFKPTEVEFEPLPKISNPSDLTIAERKLNPKIREFVIDRDEYKCVRCGNKENLHVHHIIPKEEGGKDVIKNLETLCQPCHIEEHEGQPVANLLKGGNK
jgi:HNH endonuclease